MLDRDPLARVLTIDLSRRSFSVEHRRDLFEQSIGGSGVGIRLLDEHCPQGADPLGPENAIVLCVGPLVGHYPLASKTVATFKSPHTGGLGESHAGGRSAVSLRSSGYGAVVLLGRSESPVYLVIEDGRVLFRDASALWGLRSSYTVGSVLRGLERGSGHRSILRIGPAGEKTVTYACVVTETYRHFGRLGLGAVFGSKNLKALVIAGNRSLPVADPTAYRVQYDELYQSAVRSSIMKKYHDVGTPVNVLPLQELGALPTRNLQQARFEGAENLSGEHLAEHYLGRRLACTHCPIACIHIAALRTPHPSKRYFFKTSMLGYDYEPLYSLGSMLGISDPAACLQLMDEVEIQGLDAMSTGVALAWATEAFQRGLVDPDEIGTPGLAWGEARAYIAAVRRIVSQPSDFYRALARGVTFASSIYGGTEFALAFGGNEMPGYHTGPGAYLGYLLGARHSHLDSAGYSLDQQDLSAGTSSTAEHLVRRLIEEEQWRQVLSSLVVCYFARGLYTADAVVSCLGPLGTQTDEASLQRIGAETLQRKWRFEHREGIDSLAGPLPRRIFETPCPSGTISQELMTEALRQFSAQRRHVLQS